MTWAIYGAPPFMVEDEPGRDTGIFDRIRQVLDAHWPGSPSRTLRAPFPRVLASLKDGNELCFVGGVRTPERESFATFSLPVAMFYPLRIIVRAQDRQRFEAMGPLSLKTLIADRTLRTSLLKDRSLGTAVDEIVRDREGVRVHSEFDEAFRMLLAGRLDYLVEYSNIASYQIERLASAGAVVALPFREAPPPVFSHVMCPKTEWGQRTIERANVILRRERTTPEYRRIVEAWIGEDDLATIREEYDRSFLVSE